MIAARRVEWCDTWKDTRRLKVERDTLYASRTCLGVMCGVCGVNVDVCGAIHVQ